jgi:hypothetical protein
MRVKFLLIRIRLEFWYEFLCSAFPLLDVIYILAVADNPPFSLVFRFQLQ